MMTSVQSLMQHPTPHGWGAHTRRREGSRGWWRKLLRRSLGTWCGCCDAVMTSVHSLSLLLLSLNPSLPSHVHANHTLQNGTFPLLLTLLLLAVVLSDGIHLPWADLSHQVIKDLQQTAADCEVRSILGRGWTLCQERQVQREASSLLLHRHVPAARKMHARQSQQVPVQCSLHSMLQFTVDCS